MFEFVGLLLVAHDAGSLMIVFGRVRDVFVSSEILLMFIDKGVIDVHGAYRLKLSMGGFWWF